jgi:hypothetical protein
VWLRVDLLVVRKLIQNEINRKREMHPFPMAPSAEAGLIALGTALAECDVPSNSAVITTYFLIPLCAKFKIFIPWIFHVE